MAQISVTIDGRKYRLACNEGEEARLESLAGLIDDKIGEMRKEFGEINICYAVFSKSTGALIAGPFAGTNFWSGFGGPCEANDDGDIIIQWKANHRWLAAQNVFNSPGRYPPYYTCVAVSQTADATGVTFVTSSRSLAFPITQREKGQCLLSNSEQLRQQRRV